jgi:transcriptional regulator with XRE-family HTH domain
MKRDTHLNVIGPEIRRIRKQRGWSQSTLAQRLQSAGWDITRSGLAKIECRIVWVGDFELLYFVNVFGVRVGDLFPTFGRNSSVQAAIVKFSQGSRGNCSPAGGDSSHQ